MTREQLWGIYQDACSAIGRTAISAQAEPWMAVLGTFEEIDVRAALVRWWGDTEPVQYGNGFRTRGSMMPAASDLKAMVLEALRKQREARRFHACGRRTTNDGKEYACNDGELWVRADGYWERKGKCPCRVKWEKENPREVAHA